MRTHRTIVLLPHPARNPTLTIVLPSPCQSHLLRRTCSVLDAEAAAAVAEVGSDVEVEGVAGGGDEPPLGGRARQPGQLPVVRSGAVSHADVVVASLQVQVLNLPDGAES